MKLFLLLITPACLLSVITHAFIPSTIGVRKFSTSLFGKTSHTNNEEENDIDIDVSKFRRMVLKSGILIGGYNILEMMLTTTTTTSMGKANAVERAVGSAEKECREAGNCLERGDLDGAVGWNWGAKDRCDATDPQCGPNGLIVNNSPISSLAVPVLRDLRVTHVVLLTIMIGRSEIGTLRMGLYGDVAPKAVQQLVDFLSPLGLTTMPPLFGYSSRGVSFQNSGLLTNIVPSERIQFGVPSQSAAYARFLGVSKAGDSFIPQPRPNKDALLQETPIRPHDCAGLLSIPGSGLGYAKEDTIVGKNDDEAFANAFQITAAAVPSMDREGRKVIGQLLDEDSMKFLARLSLLPTNKGLKGIIPGQDGGPPLLKVVVANTEVQSIPP